jgi:hypothetical protein
VHGDMRERNCISVIHVTAIKKCQLGWVADIGVKPSGVASFRTDGRVGLGFLSGVGYTGRAPPAGVGRSSLSGQIYPIR